MLKKLEAKIADFDRLYETVSKVKGRIDIVFANAGVGEFASFGAVTAEHFDKRFRCSRALVKPPATASSCT